MKRLSAAAAAALALTIFQPDDAWAQRGGARVGSGHSGRSGFRGGPNHRGLAMHGRATSGVWGAGVGGLPGSEHAAQ